MLLQYNQPMCNPPALTAAVQGLLGAHSQSKANRGQHLDWISPMGILVHVPQRKSGGEPQVQDPQRVLCCAQLLDETTLKIKEINALLESNS